MRRSSSRFLGGRWLGAPKAMYCLAFSYLWLSGWRRRPARPALSLPLPRPTSFSKDEHILITLSAHAVPDTMHSSP